MAFNFGNLKPEQLKKYIRQLSPGETLFEQGDMGNTMYIIVSGTFSLLEKRDESYFVVGSLSVGQVLGEKAMLTEAPYRRTYTARAEDACTLLEFDNKNLKMVEQIIPNFTSRILQIAAKRLDRANRLITLLRSMDPIDRVVSAILFLCEESGKQTPDGVVLALNVSDINQVCHVDKVVIAECLELMKTAKIIVVQKDTVVIPDLNALRQYYPELKDRVAA